MYYLSQIDYSYRGALGAMCRKDEKMPPKHGNTVEKLQYLVNVGGMWTHTLITSTTRTKEDCDDVL
jgi:hypothetical protein